MPTPEETSGPDAVAGGLNEAVRRVGDRWTLLLVDALLPGPRRFGELLEGLDGLAPNILSKRLKALEADGIVTSAPYSRRPYRVAYALTASGLELASALRLLTQWGVARGASGVAVHHRTCGTNLEARWWCPTCARAVEDGEAPDLDYL